jgi:hypothetical protein
VIAVAFPENATDAKSLRALRISPTRLEQSSMSRIRFSGAWSHVAGAALLSLSACFGDDNAGSAAIDSGGPGMDATTAETSTAGGNSDASPSASDGGEPAADSSLTDASSIQDASLDGCDGPAKGVLPSLTTGYWVYYNSVDSAAVVWDGTTLTFDSTTPACGGATLTATANWASTNGTYAATELYTGFYDSATRKVTWNGQSLANTQGSVVLDDDVATYDPSNDLLVNGSWTGGHPGTFSARHVVDAGSPSADGATE